MPSIGSELKQRPLNNGYFRSIDSNPAGDYTGMFALTFNANGTFASAAALSANPDGYTGLLRDMGVQYYDAANDVVYRRVQVVTSTGTVGGIAGTVDTSYGAFYIVVGRLGSATDGASTLATPSLFVRTG